MQQHNHIRKEFTDNKAPVLRLGKSLSMATFSNRYLSATKLQTCGQQSEATGRGLYLCSRQANTAGLLHGAQLPKGIHDDCHEA